MPELIELQRQVNESYNLIHEHMVRSSQGIEQCPLCEEYYPRISGHECTALKLRRAWLLHCGGYLPASGASNYPSNSARHS